MLTRLTKIYTSSLPELVFTRFRVNLLPEQSEEVLPQETASFLFFSNARNWILRLSDSLILQIYTNEMNKSQHIYSIQMYNDVCIFISMHHSMVYVRIVYPFLFTQSTNVASVEPDQQIKCPLRLMQNRPAVVRIW